MERQTKMKVLEAIRVGIVLDYKCALILLLAQGRYVANRRARGILSSRRNAVYRIGWAWGLKVLETNFSDPILMTQPTPSSFSHPR
jgi:hypothetical protein